MLDFSEITARNLTEVLEDKDIVSIVYDSGGYPSVITYSNGYTAELSYSNTKLIQAKYLNSEDVMVNKVSISYDGENIDKVTLT